jgi:MFS family permease
MDVSSKSLALGIWGALGALAVYPLAEFVFVVQGAMLASLGPLPTTILVTTLWTTILAIGCTMALIMGQNRYLRRPLLDSQSALTGIVGGAISGAASGCLAEGFFQYAQYVGQQNPLLVLVARLFAWAMFGCLIGLGMSFVIPNFGRFPGAVSGAVGGGIGAIAFIVAGVLAAGVILAIGGADAAAGIGDSLGRCIGTVILGFTLGFAIGLAEEATRTAWLQVTYGQSRESVRISLGDQPVCVGSDSRRCAVWAQGARAVALKFRYVDGNVMCDDIAAEKTSVVPPGHQQQVGHVTILVGTGGTSSPGRDPAGTSTPAPPPQPAPPPPPPPAGRVMPQSARAQTGRPMVNRSGMRNAPFQSSTAKPPPPPSPPPPRRT